MELDLSNLGTVSTMLAALFRFATWVTFWKSLIQLTYVNWTHSCICMQYTCILQHLVFWNSKHSGFIFSKLGVPIKTSISPYMLEEAINGTVTIKPLPLGRPVNDRASLFKMPYLWLVNQSFSIICESTYYCQQVEKQAAHFYGVTISEEQANVGIVVRVTSQAQSKFKVNLSIWTSNNWNMTNASPSFLFCGSFCTSNKKRIVA